jgi:hypothetical protein
MRDLRPDLKERLDNLSEEAARLEKRLAELKALKASLAALLAEEDARLGQPSLFAQDAGLSSAFYSFLLNAMANGDAWSVKDLKPIAEQGRVFAGDSSIGRQLHAALIGLRNRGLVEHVGSGTWRLAATNMNRIGASADTVAPPRGG